MSKDCVFSSPDAIRIHFDKDIISIDFAHTEKQNIKSITDADISEKITVQFQPKEFLTTMALMASAAFSYQKKYNVDLGISVNSTNDGGDNVEKK